MPIQILMPALSPTMEEGNLAKWHVREGDEVSAGDVIAEIETDKAVMEVEAVDEGTIGRIIVEEGAQGVAVNKPIAIILEEGEGPDALENITTGLAPAAAETGAGAAEPGPPATQGTDKVQTQTQSGKASNGGDAPLDGQIPWPTASRIPASPLARRLARAANIELQAIKGSGPNGRITKRDVEAAQTAGIGQQAPAGTAVTPRAPAQALSDDTIRALYEPDSYQLVPHDNMRRTIATRLVEAKSTIPHFYLNIDCVLNELMSARKRMNDAAEGRFKLSVNDFIIKALALALQEVPDANVTWTEEGRLLHQRSDIGVAVAVEGGLFTPVIRHADLKTLSEISNEVKDLAARARKRRLAPHEYQGGTTSISNLGMFGIKSFDAVINPPHATILAVGAGEQRPVVNDDAINVATIMSCTLSCDHRVVDGALGADLLKAFKGFIEDPVRMLI